MDTENKMTEREAVAYIEKVLTEWETWKTHHTRLVTALEVVLEKIKRKG